MAVVKVRTLDKTEVKTMRWMCEFVKLRECGVNEDMKCRSRRIIILPSVRHAKCCDEHLCLTDINRKDNNLS